MPFVRVQELDLDDDLDEHDAHAKGLLPLEQVVRRYPLAQVQRAMDDLGSGAVIKPTILADRGGDPHGG